MRKFNIYHWMMVEVISCAALFSFLGCGQKTKVESVNFDDVVELNQTPPQQGQALNICVGSMITPEEGYAYYKRLLDYIGKRLGLRVNFVDTRTYSETNSLLKDKRIDIAFVCGGPYVEGHDEFGLELLCAPQVNGKTVYYSYIIVGKDSGIENLEQLRGKKFAFVDPISNTGKLIPAYIIEKGFKEAPDTFFKECIYTYDHDKSIKTVAYGIADAAAVDSLIWDYMDKKGSEYTAQTKPILVSKPYGIPPVVARQGLEAELKNRLKTLFLNMHKDDEGKDILRGMLIEKFVEVSDADYDDIRKIKALVEK